MPLARIAVLMTCYNRRDTTLACLRPLVRQEPSSGIALDIYLVDDGCTDGTGEAARRQYPQVRVLKGDGNLFWCGGMRVAFAEAMKEDYDYYLWLNDDTALLPGAIRTLLQAACEIREREGRDGIVVGSTCDPETGEHTYGGLLQLSRWRPLGFKPVVPSDQVQRCDTMNGNCTLIPREVAQSVGNFSPEFTHAIGDIDYGLRARAQGFSIWSAPGYVGVCARNPRPYWVDANVSLRERLKILCTPKGLPPREWIAFTRRHTGTHWPLYWLKLEMRVLFPKLWTWLGK